MHICPGMCRRGLLLCLLSVSLVLGAVAQTPNPTQIANAPCKWYTADTADRLDAPLNISTCAACRAGCAANTTCRFYSFTRNGVYSIDDPTACGSHDNHGWVNTFSDGSYCSPNLQMGATLQATIASCKAVCKGTVGCGAISTDIIGTQVGRCQLYPRTACLTPAGRNFTNINQKIFLATDTDDWVNTFSEGNYCTSFGYRQLGANTTVTLAACKAQCLSNPACGAIYSQSSGSITAVCQLYPKDACVTPAGRQNNTFNAVNGRIHLAADAYFNAYSGGPFCNGTQIGSTVNTTNVDCQARCNRTTGCGAFYSAASPELNTVATCQLFPRVGCITPATRNSYTAYVGIYLAAGGACRLFSTASPRTASDLLDTVPDVNCTACAVACLADSRCLGYAFKSSTAYARNNTSPCSQTSCSFFNNMGARVPAYGEVRTCNGCWSVCNSDYSDVGGCSAYAFNTNVITHMSRPCSGSTPAPVPGPASPTTPVPSPSPTPAPVPVPASPVRSPSPTPAPVPRPASPVPTPSPKPSPATYTGPCQWRSGAPSSLDVTNEYGVIVNCSSCQQGCSAHPTCITYRFGDQDEWRNYRTTCPAESPVPRPASPVPTPSPKPSSATYTGPCQWRSGVPASLDVTNDYGVIVNCSSCQQGCSAHPTCITYRFGDQDEWRNYRTTCPAGLSVPSPSAPRVISGNSKVCDWQLFSSAGVPPSFLTFANDSSTNTCNKCREACAVSGRCYLYRYALATSVYIDPFFACPTCTLVMSIGGLLVPQTTSAASCSDCRSACLRNSTCYVYAWQGNELVDPNYPNPDVLCNAGGK